MRSRLRLLAMMGVAGCVASPEAPVSEASTTTGTTSSTSTTARELGSSSAEGTGSSSDADSSGVGSGEDVTTGDPVASSTDGGTSTGEPDITPVTFSERAVELGVDFVHASDNTFANPGQAWGDFDSDGTLDLFLTSQLAPNRLFRGERTGFTSFESAVVGLDGAINTGAVFVDYDNDHWPDLYISAWGQNTLLRNLHGVAFEDVTAGSRLGDVGRGSTAAWADYDQDGLLDVYVANYDTQDPDHLFHNEGGGVFSDTEGVLDVQTRTRLGYSASFFDYDLDGDADLYVANDKFQGNVLWRNDGAGCEGWCWTDVSVASGAGVEMESMGIALGDYDNDGDQDVFVTNIGPMVLLQNQSAQGEPRFEDVTATAGARVDEDDWGQYGWGAQFLDYDNDGWLDLYVALGRVGPGPAWPNALLRNLGDGSFQRLPDGAGAEDMRLSQGLAIADFDEDGWVDPFVSNDGAPCSLFHNGGGEAHWLEVVLAGDGKTVSSDAVGARITVLDEAGREQTREVVAGSGLGAGSSLRQHFGFGDAKPVSLSIRWPDGRTERVLRVPFDQIVRYEY